MGAAEEMELDLKLGEKIAEVRTLREKNIALRTKMGKVQQILNRMVLDPQVPSHAKMQAAAALDVFHESP
jgi:uncharacterized protein (UPF0147 family)